MKVIFSFILVLTFLFNLHAAINSKTIEYKHGDVVLEGFLIYDNLLKSKRPGILLVHEWWGQNEYIQERAKQLVNLGYIVFAIDMYGKGIKTENADSAKAWSSTFYEDRQLMRDRASAGLEILRTTRNVDPNRLGVVGYCFGGTVALELARGGADLDAVVSFHGGLSTPNLEDARNIRGDVLILHGAADPFVSPEEVTTFQNELNNAGVDWQINLYSNAKHAFTNSEANKYKLDGVAYNLKADKRSWEAMRAFFFDIFK